MLLISRIVGGHAVAVGQREHQQNGHAHDVARPEGHDAEGLAGEVPHRRHDAAHQDGPERGPLVHLFPIDADDEHHACHRADLERAGDLAQNGGGVQPQEGGHQADAHNGQLGEAQLRFVVGVRLDEGHVEVPGQGGGQGQQEGRTGGEHGGNDGHAGDAAHNVAVPPRHAVEDGPGGGVRHQVLARHTHKGGEQGEEDDQKGGHGDAGVGGLFALGAVHVGHQGGGENEAEHGAHRGADHALHVGVVHPQEVLGQGLADGGQAAHLAEGQEGHQAHTGVQHGGVDNVHAGDAPQAHQRLDDEDARHHPGHHRDVHVDHGGQHRRRGPGLHGKHDAVHHHDDDHHHQAGAVVKAELKGLGDGVGPVVAGHTVELADGEYEHQHPQGLPPVGPHGGQAGVEGGGGAAHGAGAGHHLTEHQKANQDGPQVFLRQKKGFGVIGALGPAAEIPAHRGRNHDIGDNNKKCCHNNEVL